MSSKSVTLKLKLKDILRLYNVHASLDGIPTPVKQGENIVVVRKPFDLKERARWYASGNRTLFGVHRDRYEKRRDELVREVSGGKDEVDKKDPGQLKKWIEKITEIEGVEVEVSGLEIIPYSGLRLKKNAIPTETLEVLREFKLVSDPVFADEVEKPVEDEKDDEEEKD